MADFLEVVELHWNTTPYYGNAAKTLFAKFKKTRKGLKAWSKQLSHLNRKKTVIAHGLSVCYMDLSIKDFYLF